MRLIIPVIGLLLLLFSGLGGLIRLFSYDQAYFEAIRAVIIPPSDADCPTVCVFNVRTGMAFETVADQLRDHPWVLHVNPIDRQFEPYSVEWTWNGTQPPFMAQTAILYYENQHVRDIQIPLRISLAEIWLALGTPDISLSNRALNRLIYARYHLEIISQADCHHIWAQTVRVVYRPITVTTPHFDRTTHARQLCGIREHQG